MEHFAKMKQRGQSSIEFMFLISVAMIYIATVIMPAVELSKRSAEDVTQLAQTRMAAEKISNAIDAVSIASSDAKQTLTVLLPARGKIQCTTPIGALYSGISFDFILTLDNTTPLLENENCPNTSGKSICTKEFKTISNFTCGFTGGEIGDPANTVPVTYIVVIEKGAGGITINANTP